MDKNKTDSNVTIIPPLNSISLSTWFIYLSIRNVTFTFKLFSNKIDVPHTTTKLFILTKLFIMPLLTLKDFIFILIAKGVRAKLPLQAGNTTTQWIG